MLTTKDKEKDKDMGKDLETEKERVVEREITKRMEIETIDIEKKEHVKKHEPEIKVSINVGDKSILALRFSLRIR